MPVPERRPQLLLKLAHVEFAELRESLQRLQLPKDALTAPLARFQGVDEAWQVALAQGDRRGEVSALTAGALRSWVMRARISTTRPLVNEVSTSTPRHSRVPAKLQYCFPGASTTIFCRHARVRSNCFVHRSGLRREELAK